MLKNRYCAIILCYPGPAFGNFLLVCYKSLIGRLMQVGLKGDPGVRTGLDGGCFAGKICYICKLLANPLSP